MMGQLQEDIVDGKMKFKYLAKVSGGYVNDRYYCDIYETRDKQERCMGQLDFRGSFVQVLEWLTGSWGAYGQQRTP